jgi:gluconate 2-dehydrogenase gamma chain
MPDDKSLAKDLVSRRRFMMQSAAGFSAAWAVANWPAMLSAAEHAHRAVGSGTPPQFEFFTAEEAKEVDAIAARIIPTDDMPGAREAGVVYFIDKALVTFAKENQKLYRAGLPELQARVQEMNPGKKKFSELDAEHQDAVLLSLDENHPGGRRAFRRPGNAPSFFDTVRQHAISGFLIDPEAGRGGNRDAVGWKVIGRDPDHAFQPPFGFYDKDYPGWKAAPDGAAKP